MDWLIKRIKSFNDKKAIIYKGKTYLYSDLLLLIDKYSNIISPQIKEGEVIALLSDYSFFSIALFLSLIKNKNIIVPIMAIVEGEINQRVLEAEVDKIITLTDENIDIVNFHNKKQEKHNLIAQIQSFNKSGLILFSSGSTGKPKTMIHDLDNLINTFKNRREKRLIFFIFLMFDHIGGLNTLFNCLSMGATMVIPENRDADYVCSLIEKHKIHILPTSPTFLNLIIISESHKRFNLSSLLMITYGTEPMSEGLLKRLKEIFPRTRFLQTFGTSETGIAQTRSKSSTSTAIKIIDSNIEYRIVDNELWLRSKTQVLGYLNTSMEKFTKDGWFKTGDLVEEISEEGYIKIKGRNSDLINIGGEKVFPIEVEDVLLQIPIVDDCIIYSEKNAITGQAVVADVVLNNDVKKSEARKTIRNYCNKKLSNYKIPTKINIIENINYGNRFKKKRLR